MYAFAPITVLALRKADPDRTRPYRVPAISVLAPLAFIAANEIIYWTSWIRGAEADAGHRRRLCDVRDLTRWAGRSSGRRWTHGR